MNAEELKDMLMDQCIDKRIMEMQKHKILTIEFALSLTARMKLKNHMNSICKTTVLRGLLDQDGIDTMVDSITMKSDSLITGFCIGYDHKEKETISR
jgi:hypothetical protein